MGFAGILREPLFRHLAGTWRTYLFSTSAWTTPVNDGSGPKRATVSWHLVGYKILPGNIPATWEQCVTPTGVGPGKAKVIKKLRPGDFGGLIYSVLPKV